MIAEDAVAADRPLEPAEWMRCIVKLPSLPSAFLAAVEVLSRDHVPTSACIEAIERDQALTVRVLRLANSAFYGAPGRVSRIGDAVQMLGLRTVASTLAAVSLGSMLGSLRCEGFCFDTYWRHTLRTAIAARELAPFMSLDAGEAFLMGLLHDVGLLILALTDPVLEAQALQRSRTDGVALHRAESQLFGVSHADVGAAVARQWKFPAAIVDAIASHHRPSRYLPTEGLTAANLVRMANQFAHAMEASGDEAAGLLAADPLWSRLGISDASLLDLTRRITVELDIVSGA